MRLLPLAALRRDREQNHIQKVHWNVVEKCPLLILFLSVLMGSSDQIKLPENCMAEET